MSKSHKIRDWNLPSLLTQEFSKVIKKCPKVLFLWCASLLNLHLCGIMSERIIVFKLLTIFTKKLHLHFKWFGNLILNKQRPKISVQGVWKSQKVSFNIASEASYVYILSGQKFIKNAKNGSFWRVFENLKLAVKQCYQTGRF